MLSYMSAQNVSFTLKANQRLKQIFFDIGLTLHSEHPVSPTKRLIVKSLWNTASIKTSLSPSLHQRLFNATASETNKLDLYLPNNIRIAALKPIIHEPSLSDYECQIGMDIIGLGDSAFSNVGGKSVFSFRIPSTQVIDFVAEQATPVRKQKTNIIAATRNQRCPCGSGKKHKNCCAKR